MNVSQTFVVSDILETVLNIRAVDVSHCITASALLFQWEHSLLEWNDCKVVSFLRHSVYDIRQKYTQTKCTPEKANNTKQINKTDKQNYAV